MLFLDERVEAGPCVDALGRESHDLSLCSHLTWMHERRVPSRRVFAGYWTQRRLRRIPHWDLVAIRKHPDLSAFPSIAPELIVRIAVHAAIIRRALSA